MCHYQTLYHDDQTGYVIRCPECEKIQVAYANLVTTFGMEDFSSFRWWIRKIKDEQQPVQNRTSRTIVIPTPCEGMKLVVSPRELDELDGMLDAADTELQSLHMLGLFNAN